MNASACITAMTSTPSYTYHIERTAALPEAGTVWEDLGSATTDGTGVGGFTDSNPLPDRGFYRAAWRN